MDGKLTSFLFVAEMDLAFCDLKPQIHQALNCIMENCAQIVPHLSFKQPWDYILYILEEGKQKEKEKNKIFYNEEMGLIIRRRECICSSQMTFFYCRYNFF